MLPYSAPAVPTCQTEGLRRILIRMKIAIMPPKIWPFTKEDTRVTCTTARTIPSIQRNTSTLPLATGSMSDLAHSGVPISLPTNEDILMIMSTHGSHTTMPSAYIIFLPTLGLMPEERGVWQHLMPLAGE